MDYRIINGSERVAQNSQKWDSFVYIFDEEINSEHRYYIDKCSERFERLTANQTWIFKTLSDYESVRYVELAFIGWPLRQYEANNETIELVFKRYYDDIVFKLIKISQYNYYEDNTSVTILKFAHPLAYDRDEERYCGTGLIPPVSYQRWKHIELRLLGNRFAGSVRFCALDLYSLPKDCGEPDGTLHSRVSLREHFTDRECVKFECEYGYHIIGDSELECGEYAKWIGNTPLCKPNITCAMISTSIDSHLVISYENLEMFDNKEFAVANSVQIYSCSGSTTLLGMSRRICSSNGTWSGLLPVCVRK